MSGLVKGVKKVFKAVGTVMKSPIFKAIAIAAAVYFTGGLALGAMGSEFAATLPGITGLADTLGITAGAFGTAAVDAGAALSATSAALNAGYTGAGGLASSAVDEAAISAGAGAGTGAVADTAAGVVANTAATVAPDVGAGVTSAATDAGYTGAGGLASSSVDEAASGAAAGAPGSTTSGIVDGATTVGPNGASPYEASSGAQPMNGTGVAKTGLTNGIDTSGLSNGAKKMLLDGLSKDSMYKMGFDALKEGGLAVFKGLQQKQGLDQQMAEYQQNRADVIRRGQVPDISSIYKGYKTPGVVNSFVNQPQGG